MRGMSAESVIRDFCRAISRQDLGEILGFFTEDAVYHNIPFDPVRGKPAIEATLRLFLDPKGKAEFELRAIAASGDTVLTERVDRFAFGGKQVELPVMGAFEVTAQGKISAWRDYFDMAMITKQTS
jgi:limonene-1,2-epoxide hydrolase